MEGELKLEACFFCGLKRCDTEAAFCTSCGRPLMAPTEVRSMDMGKTTANYDPYHRDWKPWREPTLLKKRPKKKKNDTFYNQNVWGKNIPQKSIKKAADCSKVNAEEFQDGQLVFSDHHEFRGVRFRGFTWQKVGGGLIRQRRKRQWKQDEPFDPLLDSDVISPLGVYEAPWISATAIVHISLVEAIRVGENRIKKSNCWFRVGVTDSTWRSPLDMAVSPMDRQTPVTACQGEGFPPSRETNKDAEGNINVSELKAINEPDSDLDSGSELPSASVSESKQEETTEEEFDDLLVLQYIDNAVAKFIVDADNNWVDAAVIDSKNSYMLDHLQKTLKPLSQRVLVSSSRAAEESYDQISFIGAKTISSFSILTMSSYFPFEGVFKQHIDHEKLRDIDVNFTKRDFERQDLQLYFDQTILQTTARIPLGEHYRGEYITCMVRVEALNSITSYVSHMCRRLDINEEDFQSEIRDANSRGFNDEPIVGALKFLILPLIMKSNIRPKILVFSLASLSVLLEKSFDFSYIMSNDDPENDPKQDFIKACLQILGAVRFENVRSFGSGGSPAISVKAVLSGVPNTFEIIDMDELGVEIDSTDPLQDKCHEIKLTVEPIEQQDLAASRIQNRWRQSFQFKENKKEEEMQDSLAVAITKIQCMFRCFKARGIVKKRIKDRQPTSFTQHIKASLPEVVDEHWRFNKQNKISRICIIRGTTLLLVADFFDSDNTLLGTLNDSWDYVRITASCVLDCDRDSFMEEPPASTSIKLSRNRLLDEIYMRPNDSVSIIGGLSKALSVIECSILNMLSNVTEHLDLFYAIKKGIMILKFNGPGNN